MEWTRDLLRKLENQNDLKGRSLVAVTTYHHHDNKITIQQSNEKYLLTHL